MNIRQAKLLRVDEKQLKVFSFFNFNILSSRAAAAAAAAKKE